MTKPKQTEWGKELRKILKRLPVVESRFNDEIVRNFNLVELESFIQDLLVKQREKTIEEALKVLDMVEIEGYLVNIEWRDWKLIRNKIADSLSQTKV